MTYLTLAFSTETCDITEFTSLQVILKQQQVLLTSKDIADQLGQVISVITEAYQDIQGIIMTEELKNIDQTGCFTTAEGLTVNVLNHLMEKMNVPVIRSVSGLSWAENLKDLSQQGQEMSWQLNYYGYTPGKSNYSVESLLTTGNGYLGLRGSLLEADISEGSYPATYIAGLYNLATSEVEGQAIGNEDFVNAPNLQYLSLKIGEGPVINLAEVTINSLHRQLNLRDGLFQAELNITDQAGHQLAIKTQRVVNMADKHHYALAYEFTPLNFNGEVKVLSKSDASVHNFNVERYRSLEQHHLMIESLEAEGLQTAVKVKTKDSEMTVQQVSELAGDFVSAERITTIISDQEIIQEVPLVVEQNQTYRIEKSVSVYRSEAHQELNLPKGAEGTKSFGKNYQESQKAWESLWQQAEIQVSGDLMSQKLLNLHTYHLLVSGSPFSNQDLDVSITARGLHGEAYRGHIFWDEIFIMPFYTMHFPEMAKQLLMYRYHRLDAAKANALEAGYSGAMFPWQSGLDGTEQSQELHLNPLNGEWGEDYSRLQRHVSLAIAYNVWLYWNNTGDQDFMASYGGELLMEIAEFWRSKAEWQVETERYSIAKVMGPDEFHEAYPESQTGGLTDNAYTNMMVVWLFEEVAKLQKSLEPTTLAQIQAKTKVTAEKLAEMETIRHKLTLEINEEGVIAQYAGYFDLKEIDWDFYRQKYGNVYRMDRILSANGESADDYQVAKQADTLMTFYNFSKVKVDQILADLAYRLPADYLEKNLEYYLQRTSHGSTLSRIVHAQLAENVGKRDLSWQLYQEALRSDYQDIQGGTTAEGIHTGVMAATLYVTLATYGGLEIREDQLSLKPNLPEKWQGLDFKLQRLGIDYQFTISLGKVTVTASHDTKVIIAEEEYDLQAKEPLVVNY